MKKTDTQTEYLFTQEPAWYCVCVYPKKERRTAECIRLVAGLPVFAPSLVLLKNTRLGPRRFREPLFPGYIFIRADLTQNYRRLLAVEGVRKFVQFGTKIPPLPDSVVEQLREGLGGESREIQPPPLAPGMEVSILSGPFRDLRAVVEWALPARDRVRLLLEFLGRTVAVELPIGIVMAEVEHPRQALRRSP